MTTTYHFKIESHRTTELVAKRRAIEEAMRRWDENESEYFVELKVSYLPAVINPKRVTESIVARREIVSHYLKVECLQYWREKNGSLYLHKLEYLELWKILKDNQPKEEKKMGRIEKIFKAIKDKKIKL